MKPSIAANLLPFLLLASGLVHAQKAIDPARINQIADEGFNHGQVVTIATLAVGSGSGSGAVGGGGIVD